MEFNNNPVYGVDVTLGLIAPGRHDERFDQGRIVARHSSPRVMTITLLQPKPGPPVAPGQPDVRGVGDRVNARIEDALEPYGPFDRQCRCPPSHD